MRLPLKVTLVLVMFMGEDEEEEEVVVVIAAAIASGGRRKGVVAVLCIGEVDEKVRGEALLEDANGAATNAGGDVGKEKEVGERGDDDCGLRLLLLIAPPPPLIRVGLDAVAVVEEIVAAAAASAAAIGHLFSPNTSL